MTERERLLRILESVLPYVEYAAAKELPNALHYVEEINRLVWRKIPIVRPEQCTIPKCKSCGKHVGHEHEEGCLIALAEAVKRKRRTPEMSKRQ